MEDYKDYAGTPDEEMKVAEAAAVIGIIEYRKRRKTAMYFEGLRKPIEYPNYNAETLFTYLKETKAKEIYGVDEKGKSLMEIDPYNEKIIKTLCLYFTNDKRFEAEGYSLEKGILLYGNIGCGKTKIMELFTANNRASYAIKRCKEIADNYYRALQKKNDPNINLELLYGKIPTGIPEKFMGHTELGVCFDDLGTEDELKHYGNSLNVMSEIFLARYNRLFELKGLTHCTTNLPAEMIEKEYGPRIRSRMREMFNTIKFDANAPDRRK